MDPWELANRIDHTLLKIGASYDDLKKFVDEGVRYKVRGLVTSPINVPIVKKYLAKRGPRVISVVAFPYGETFISVKFSEIDELAELGVDELDIVLNTSYIVKNRIDKFKEEAHDIVKYVRQNYPDIAIKLIIEVTILTPKMVEEAIKVINHAKPDYFKTSTGYGPRGTSVDDVKYIRSYLDSSIRIKAAGGIRSLDQAIELIKAGADVIGSSTGVSIIKEALSRYG